MTGIRMDQFMGLNEWARKFVRGGKVLVYVEKITRVYPDGREEALKHQPVYKSSVEKRKVVSFIMGCSETTTLFISMPWSSGPVFFLTLQNEKGNWASRSLWSKEVINNV